MNQEIEIWDSIKEGEDKMDEFIVISIKEDGARYCQNLKTGEYLIFDKDSGIEENIGEKFEIENA